MKKTNNGQFKKGHKPYSGIEKGWFKKGVTSWNKDTKGVMKPNKTSFKKGTSPWNTGKKIPYLHHDKQFKKGMTAWNKGIPYMQKEKHPNWIADRSKLVKSEKKHLDGRYREWMFGVKIRDHYKCKINNSDCKGRLESHHILNWEDYPELRYEINNGITLCHAHHPRGRAEEKRLSSYLQSLVSVSN